MKRRRAKLLRDLSVIAIVLLPAAFRPGTGSRLNHKVDANGKPCGSLQSVSDSGRQLLTLVVDRKDFKNFRSNIIKRGFRRKLSHLIDPADLDLISEYLEEARSLLAGGEKTDALIVRSERFPRHTPKSFSEYVCRLTSRIMRESPDPLYCGATRLSPNQIRKILATNAYKLTGDMEEAKRAVASEAGPVYTHVEAERQSERTEDMLNLEAQAWRATKEVRVRTP